MRKPTTEGARWVELKNCGSKDGVPQIAGKLGEKNRRPLQGRIKKSSRDKQRNAISNAAEKGVHTFSGKSCSEVYEAGG